MKFPTRNQTIASTDALLPVASMSSLANKTNSNSLSSLPGEKDTNKGISNTAQGGQPSTPSHEDITIIDAVDRDPKQLQKPN